MRYKSGAGGQRTREALLNPKSHRRVNRRQVAFPNLLAAQQLTWSPHACLILAAWKSKASSYGAKVAVNHMLSPYLLWISEDIAVTCAGEAGYARSPEGDRRGF